MLQYKKAIAVNNKMFYEFNRNKRTSPAAEAWGT